jgi:hypothetical protein
LSMYGQTLVVQIVCWPSSYEREARSMPEWQTLFLFLCFLLRMDARCFPIKYLLFPRKHIIAGGQKKNWSESALVKRHGVNVVGSFFVCVCVCVCVRVPPNLRVSYIHAVDPPTLRDSEIYMQVVVWEHPTVSHLRRRGQQGENFGQCCVTMLSPRPPGAKPQEETRKWAGCLEPFFCHLLEMWLSQAAV